jgi:Integrase core domain
LQEGRNISLMPFVQVIEAWRDRIPFDPLSLTGWSCTALPVTRISTAMHYRNNDNCLVLYPKINSERKAMNDSASRTPVNVWVNHHVPLSHPFVERLIGTIRRELLDQVFFWNASDLEQRLAAFRHYYNTHRSHSALEGATPEECSEKRKVQLADLNRFQWKSRFRGL